MALGARGSGTRNEEAIPIHRLYGIQLCSLERLILTPSHWHILGLGTRANRVRITPFIPWAQCDLIRQMERQTGSLHRDTVCEAPSKREKRCVGSIIQMQTSSGIASHSAYLSIGLHFSSSRRSSLTCHINLTSISLSLFLQQHILAAHLLNNWSDPSESPS